MQAIIGKEFLKKVEPYIKQARKSIDIVIFDWRWYPNGILSDAQRFNLLVADAARRGVTVRAVVEREDIIPTLKRVGIEAKRPYSKKMVHAKLMLIDSTTLIIGSHNYTQRGIESNHEVSIVIENQIEIDRITSFFLNLWQV